MVEFCFVGLVLGVFFFFCILFVVVAWSGFLFGLGFFWGVDFFIFFF